MVYIIIHNHIKPLPVSRVYSGLAQACPELYELTAQLTEDQVFEDSWLIQSALLNMVHSHQ
jgi:hypothetical protein